MSQLRKHDKNIRLSHELSEGEKKATGNRKVKVLKCLKHLGIACDKNNVPNIAVLGSGGGLRAMIALLGTLVEMKNQGLLDAIMYLCGVSGSTWCMSLLYKDKDWTEKVQDLEEYMCNAFSTFSWSHQEAYSLVREAAEDELFSLTDVWASFFVYKMLQQYDETKLSKHEDTSTCGTNPYPIYAAVEENKLKKESENSPGTWFEFTPHESGFPGLGAFVCTKDLGSKFENGMLKNNSKEKNVCYLQALWGSALGSMDENRIFVAELIHNTFFGGLGGEQESAECEAGQLPKMVTSIRGRKRTSEMAMPSLGRGTDCTCAHCRGIILLLELQFQASAGKDSEGVFRELKEILKGEKSKKAYQKCCEMSETWGSKTWEERMADCAELGRIFETEHGGEKPESSDGSHGKRAALEYNASPHSRQKPGSLRGSVSRVLGPVTGSVSSVLGPVTGSVSSVLRPVTGSVSSVLGQVTGSVSSVMGPVTGSVSSVLEPVTGSVSTVLGSVWSGHNFLQKICNCVCHWKWGSTYNFLYKCRDAHATGLARDKVIHLIDAGLAINSAYPLVLRPERKVKLILSFDFSAGDPFETIKKTATYCEANQIPFPKIDKKKLKNPNNPSDCYIFKGKDVPTVMHFPLFNSMNCPGEIDDFRNKFPTFSLSYPDDDVKQLLKKAKMNVSNNREMILEEIQQIVSSSTKNF